MAAGQITVDLLLKTGSFETDTKRAGKSLRGMQKDAEAVGKAIGLAFAAATAATVAFAKSQINQLDALNDISDATGSTVENLSALEDVARRNGQTLDDVSSILVKFNAALKEADGKNGVSQALKNIGLDVQALRKLDPAEALRQTAVAFQKFGVDGESARYVQELFGKSVKEAAPFLKDLAEKGALNAKVTTEQAKAAEEFNKNLFDMQKNTVDAARAIIGDLLPAINAVFRDVKGGSFFDNVFGTLGLGSATAAEALVKNSTRINDAIADTQKSISKLKESAGDSGNIYAAKGIADLEQKLAGLRSEAAATEKQMALLSGLNKGSAPKPEAAKPALAPLPKGATGVDPFIALIKSAREMRAVAEASLNSEEELSDALKARAKIVEQLDNKTLSLTKAQKAQLFGELDLADAAQKGIEAKKLSAKLTEEAVQDNAQFIDQQRQIRDSLLDAAKAAQEELAIFGLSREAIEARAIAFERDKAARLDKQAQQAENAYLDDNAKLYRDQAKAIREAADARQQVLAQQTRLQNDPLAGAMKGLDDYLEHISKAGDATRDAVSSALSSLEDLTVEALRGGDIKSAAKSLVNQIISEFYRLQVVRPLLNSIFGAGGGLESILRLLNGGSLAGGNTTQSGPTGGVDFSGSGFPLASGTNYVPYDGFKATLHKGESVVPKAYNPAAGAEGGTVVQVINNTGASVREERGESGGKKFVKLIIGELTRDSRRGGQTRQATREAVGPRLRRG